jgi:hypothetical protein
LQLQRLPCLFIAGRFFFWRRPWTVRVILNETAPFSISKWYFWFNPWMFLQFCNQAPRKSFNWIPWV